MEPVATRALLAKSLSGLAASLAANPRPFKKFGSAVVGDLSNVVLGTSLERVVWHYSSQRAGSISAIRLGSPRVGFESLQPTQIRSKIQELQSDGYTISLNEIDIMSPEVDGFCKQISDLFYAHCYANLYISPPNAQGFPSHRDPQKVLALQVFGQKSWDLGGDCEDGSTSVETVKLRSGEMLFLNEMVLHKATTRNEPSVHLTFGINVLKVKDLFQLLCSRIEEKAAAAGLSGLDVPVTFKQTCHILERELEYFVSEIRTAAFSERRAHDLTE